MKLTNFNKLICLGFYLIFLNSCEKKLQDFSNLNLDNWNIKTTDYIKTSCNLKFLPTKTFPKPSEQNFLIYLNSKFLFKRDLLKKVLNENKLFFNEEVLSLKEEYVRDDTNFILNPIYYIGDTHDMYIISFENDKAQIEKFIFNNEDFNLTFHENCYQKSESPIDIGRMSLTILSTIDMKDSLAITTEKFSINN